MGLIPAVMSCNVFSIPSPDSANSNLRLTCVIGGNSYWIKLKISEFKAHPKPPTTSCIRLYNILVV